MITDTTQRWLLGRDIRRPAGETIRPEDCDVQPTMDADVAREFIRTHHYQGNPSSTAHRFPLYYRGVLSGVALFGPPASENAHLAVWGERFTQKQAVTLGRLVLLDEVPDNGESLFVGRCFDHLRARGVLAVESCSDPQPRSDAAGNLTFRGHFGTVYQALNARYVGRTLDSTLSLLPDGTCLSKRSQSKLRKGERGNTRPVAQLERWGARPLRDDEDAAAWLKTWRTKICRTMRHRGCYRYLWALSRRHRGALAAHADLAYPKQRDGWAP